MESADRSPSTVPFESDPTSAPDRNSSCCALRRWAVAGSSARALVSARTSWVTRGGWAERGHGEVAAHRAADDGGARDLEPVQHPVDQARPALHGRGIRVDRSGRLSEPGQVDGKAATLTFEGVDLVVPHRRLKRERMEEDDGVAGAAIGHVARLTRHLEQRHGRLPWGGMAQRPPQPYRMRWASSEPGSVGGFTPTNRGGMRRAMMPDRDASSGPANARTSTYSATNGPMRSSSPASAASVARMSENSPRPSTVSPMFAADPRE